MSEDVLRDCRDFAVAHLIRKDGGCKCMDDGKLGHAEDCIVAKIDMATEKVMDEAVKIYGKALKRLASK